ncbi:MAG: hypothetical protein CVU34_16640 [Betaproteobacteria bacterium HGW-Betaproteobacteria-7]|jgi:aspartate/methionine/tyrosine aminotransferase|nr:MAG: hypothetical protein CVU34_16640 [Betaproteobacteria bacterium HGW-Betaproteobacteria-7]
MIDDELAAALDGFRQKLKSAKEEIGAAVPYRNRLEALLACMFGQLLLPHGAAALGIPSALIPRLQDNLDTGNSYHEPFPAFTDSLHLDVTGADSSRLYHGPEAIEELVISARAFAEQAGLVSAATAESLDVVAGMGTVHLYDSVCRLVIERPGDGVIVPTPTYGFFLPQIERAGGDVIPLSIQDGVRVHPADVAKLIVQSNAHRLAMWRAELRPKLELAKLRWPEEVNWDALGISLQTVQTQQEADSLLAEYVLLLGKQVSKALSPPRVVGFLQINPHVSGLTMSEADVLGIAEILATCEVVAIEDLAYHSMHLSLTDYTVASFLKGPATAYTLVGFSKPYSVAAHRVGVLLTRQPIQPLQRLIESSVGFVSPAVQKAMAAVLGAGKQQLMSYHDNARSNPLEGYAFKRDVLLALIQGQESAVNSENRAKVFGRIERELDALLFGLGVEQQVVSRFMKRGLSDLLRVECVPQAGIFVLVSCRPFLQLRWVQALNLTSSFDFFAWAAFFTGVRSIPEEAMGGLSECHILRLSLSPPVATLVVAAFLVWLAADRFRTILPFQEVDEQQQLR